MGPLAFKVTDATVFAMRHASTDRVKRIGHSPNLFPHGGLRSGHCRRRALPRMSVHVGFRRASACSESALGKS
eukprot:12547584-Alexandrium_andersonii.AAC.1